MGDWTLFSNHGHVLVCLARNREARLRDVAGDIGITERAVQKIVHELQHAGFISISKHGRCNRYEINTRKNLRHTLESQCTVGKLLQLFAKPDTRGGKKQSEESAPVEVPAAAAPMAAKISSPAPVAPKKVESAEHGKPGHAKPDSPKPDSPKPDSPKPDSPKPERPKSDSRGPDTRNQGSLF